ncbi:putative metallo-hydrolase yycJ [Waddlia chondrophila 2032/99]|uniref:Metallo-beta-lactamase superfamily protein n=2 Tax=Waddlia chondrophila TaxID=71667 RepID=D6YRT8_WADCW|nr:MBL fold metallo-hydrolase [Waddlia chondrophila]ADI38783.1 Metallo-beta-lactamase superfamily protein [Waddlia chondrophila WSU 86-1044]CCB91098.1 putative metallo-hydrolase yycJ [Waddlia chondrophila 2032/99]
MFGYTPLASGSKGNCIYLCTPHCKLLIDAGMSGLAIKRRLEEINVDIDEIDAILVTHEHSDHIQGLRVLAFKHRIPVFANHETAKGIVNRFHDCPKFKIFSTGESFEYCGLEIHPFSIQHDTLDPVAFTIKIDNLKIGFCTDLGFVTSLVRKNLLQCDYLYLEANHEPSMVHSSARPDVYKQRVLGRSGHLSNQACAELLTQIAHPNLKHVHLAHLSEECNSEEKAMSTVKQILSDANMNLELSIAPQHSIGKSVVFN